MARITEEHNLEAINPELAKQWHRTKNVNLTPSLVAPFSNRKVWWICDKAHEWQAPIDARSRGTGCPYCYGRRPLSEEYNLQVINPPIAKEWHPTKNGSLAPRDVAPNSTKKVWWICEKGHEWEAKVQVRNKGSRDCPHCVPGKAVATWAEKRLKKLRQRGDAPARSMMRKVGETPSGNILVEMSPQEWERLSVSRGLPANLSGALVNYRKKHGLTQFQLAEKIGIGRSRLQVIEKGLAHNISFRTYQRIISTIS